MGMANPILQEDEVALAAEIMPRDTRAGGTILNQKVRRYSPHGEERLDAEIPILWRSEALR